MNTKTDKLCMLLKCHSKMPKRQAMFSKMLLELGRILDPVTFWLILQMVICPLHQINLPDAYLLVPKQQLKKKATRETKIICRITPNPELMTEWADKSATLYLATTIYYWIKKTIGNISNMKKVVNTFRVKLMALRQCINRHIYEGGTTTQKRKSDSTSLEAQLKSSKKKKAI